MKTYTYGTTPEDVIKQVAQDQTPDGYSMTIRNQEEWSVIADCVNQGIDSHLEAFTESTFDNGECLVHPSELHVLLRRLAEHEDFDVAGDLRSCILYTLDIEEI